MFKFLYCFLGLILPFTSLFGQKKESKPEFGKLPMAELVQAYSEIDSLASAEVLYDYADVDFEVNDYQGFVITMKVHKRIKIYNKSALDQGNFTIRTYEQSGTNREVVSGIKGLTYNMENGFMAWKELDKKSIFFEKVQEGVSQYKISMPNVKEGSVVELQYVISTPLNLRNKPKAWLFQGEIPVKWSELDITIPSHFFYQVIMGGYLPLYRNNQEVVDVSMGSSRYDTKGVHYDFVVKNAPAFKDEKFVPAESDFISRIDFELSRLNLPGQPEKSFSTTWEELDRTLRNSEFWGGRLKPNKDVKDLAASFVNINDPLERLTKIHGYISSVFKWDGYVSVWASDKIKKLFDTKTGNATELNILLCSVLREAGLDANLVILSTRSNGRINLIYPLLDKFNYTIVGVSIGDQLVYVDASDPLSSPGLLPSRCIVEDGRLIHENGGYFIKLKTNDSYSEMITVKAEIQPEDGILKGSFNQSSAGLLALESRTNHAANGEESFKEKLKNKEGGWEYDNISLVNFDNKEPSTTVSYDFKISEGGIMPDIMYIPSMLTHAIKENPLKRKTREFPVDFGHVINQTYKGVYKIPEGFEVESMPEPIGLSLPGSSAKFLYSVSVSGNELTTLSRIVFKNKVFSAEEYPYLREFYAKIVEKQGEQIVLRQKM
ncbi:hypothetical protein SAMN06298216_3038 [Spirosomataceae bacterium TFI 002]|nr:hypothetical protein SAMN06298216_3038 [Spirosomataceae bacterium TFI 002]